VRFRQHHPSSVSFRPSLKRFHEIDGHFSLLLSLIDARQTST